MTQEQFETLVRDYADGKISWQLMKQKGIRNYLTVLGALGNLGLKPPKAPLELTEKARGVIRRALQAQMS
jgi:hypothetical protein